MCEPSREQRWRDSCDELIILSSVKFNRVEFIRDGYKHPCSYPLVRFVKEFTFAFAGSDTEIYADEKH